MKFHLFPLFFVLFFTNCSKNHNTSSEDLKADASQAVIDADLDNGMYLGRGYDTLTGEVKGDCVTLTEPVSLGNLRGQRVQFSLLKIEDHQTFSSHLELAASASMKAGMGTLKGKASFANSIMINDYSLYLLVKVEVLNTPVTMLSPELRPKAEEVLVSQGDENFRKRCGDEFIIGYTTGGEFYSVIELKTRDENHRKEISSTFDARYGMIAKGEFSTVLEQIVKKNKSNLSIYLYQTGGDTNESLLQIGSDEIIKKALEFPQQVGSQNGYIFKMSTASYDNLFLPEGKGPIDVSRQKTIINKLNEYRFSNLKILANIDYILSNQREFIEPDIEYLNETANKIRGNINLIYKMASECFKNYNDCKLPEKLDLPRIRFPERVKDEEPIKCVMRPHELCGPKAYQLKASDNCPPQRYKSGISPICGIENYVEARSSSCGVELYNEGSEKSICGTDRGTAYWNNGSCPSGYANVPSHIEGQLQRSILRGGTQYHCEKVLTCRSSHFGVERYKLCRHPDHGAKYKTCEHSSFGVAEYQMCRHEKHGVDEYKECMILESDDNNGMDVLCPLDI